MNLTWHGLSCFKIQGENITLITDPFDKSLGLKVPRLSAEIVIISQNQPAYNNQEAVKGIGESSPFIITGAGEYEIRGVFVYGLAGFDDKNGNRGREENIIYRIEIDNLTVVHLGGLSHPLLNGQLENLKQVDILLVPVGGGTVLTAKLAAEVINQIEPRLIIPMHYKIPGLNIKLEPLDKFCKEIGVCPKENLDKFKITKKDLPAEEMKVVVLNKS